MNKEVQVVMLPAENEYGTVCVNHNNKMFHKSYSAIENYHLYIVSDDKIKEGDWFIFDKISESTSRSHPWNNKKYVESCINNTYFSNINEIVDCNNNKYRKIVATTDILLTKKTYCNCGKGYQNPNCNKKDNNKICNQLLPKPSKQFINQYIKSWNNRKFIKNVLVEYSRSYEIIQEQMGFPEDTVSWWVDKLKINEDNTVNIKLFKGSWNREEIIELLLKYSKKQFGTQENSKYVTDWIDKNL